jgi:hypothetical protein
MRKAQDLIMMLAYETVTPLDEVSLKARRLREAGLFVRETRSPNSPRATPRDVAHLLVMLLSERPASAAKQTIDDAMEMTIGSGDLKHTRQFDAMLGHLSVFQDDDHSLVDALEALIKCAIDDPDEFIEEPGRRFWETYVTFNRSEFSATLHLVVGDPVIPRLRHEAIDVVVEYAHPQTMHGGRGLRRAFQRVNTASATLFRNIGLAFRNGETP